MWLLNFNVLFDSIVGEIVAKSQYKHYRCSASDVYIYTHTCKPVNDIGRVIFASVGSDTYQIASEAGLRPRSDVTDMAMTNHNMHGLIIIIIIMIIMIIIIIAFFRLI